jgi:hypothetical protein
MVWFNRAFPVDGLLGVLKISSQHACKTLAAEQCASRLFLQNLHLARRQQDANFIWLVASRMQIGYFVLHGH